MDALVAIKEVNFWLLFTSTIIVLVAAKYIIEVIEWFCKKFGIQTKAMREKQNDHNTLMKLQADHKKDIEDLKKSHQDAIKEFTVSIKDINSKLDSMRDENIEKDIGDMRWTIIKFSTDLSNGMTASRESYEYIFKTYERYEKILKAHGKENGLVDESIIFVREKYHECLENGSF